MHPNRKEETDASNPVATVQGEQHKTAAAPFAPTRAGSKRHMSSGMGCAGSGCSPGRLTLTCWAIARMGARRYGADRGPMSMLGLTFFASCTHRNHDDA